ncbi:MAG: beta-ketoacyl-ACP synthase III [Desulfotalea sp.]
MKEVFITDMAAFLPNEPVDNDSIEDVLGKINDIPSRTKKRILKSNKIVQRYYAIDPSSGKFTHTNAQLVAEAVRKLSPYENFSLADIDCLSCGTTGPDLSMPGHALAVAGELKLRPCDAVSTAGICIAGVTALKYAYMNVAIGSAKNAVATGSELASSYMRANFFELGVDPDDDLEAQPLLAFHADFLRWMLSDGAGAAYLSDKKNEKGLSLRIDWIENLTYAGEFDTCMYAGGIKQADGSVKGWREAANTTEVARENYMAVKQDVALLKDNLMTTAVDRALMTVVNKYSLTPDDYAWYVPHYSSAFFREQFHDRMEQVGFHIPYEKWFTNLANTGNMGSASIYVILAELFKSGKLKKDEKILCFIPESGRFSHCYMQLTVV